MKTIANHRHWQTAAVLALGALSLAPAAPAPAADVNVGVLISQGRSADWDGWDDWQDWDDTLLRMQRESIASQEEQAREAGRTVRREEVEKSREKDSEERAAYFDALLESSRASLRAPAGVPYRRPGHVSGEPPAEGTPAITVRGVTYLYDQGIFWLQQGSQYVVVTAPVGAVVDRPPRGSVPAQGLDRPVWYYFGAFYAEAPGGWAVVAPPAGLTVFYLPDGYSREKAGGVDVFRFGDTLYRPVFIQGVLAYQVTAN